MEYRGYYDPNGQGTGGFYTPEPPRRRRSGGTFFFVAVVFTLVGILLAYLVLPNLRGQLEQIAPTPRPEYTRAPEPTPTPGLPAATPTPAQMPELDGPDIIIEDAYNPFPDIIQASSGAVVGVINYANYTDFANREFEMEQGGGSGFVISSSGYIVTNAHVVEGAQRIEVIFKDGTQMDAEVRGVDKIMDVAVLKVERDGLTALKLGQSAAARTGEFVIAIGNPTGQRLADTTTFGIVSSIGRSVNIDGRTNTYIQTDAAINPGNSGGPLINARGEVMGITSAKTLTAGTDEYGNPITAEGIGFAIPIDDALPVIEQLIRFGFVARPGVGISIVEPTPEDREAYDLPEGLLVASVSPGGPAEKAGLRVDDVIVECNGVPVRAQDAFIAQVQGMAVGDECKLRYWRDGKYDECVVIVGDLNQIN